MGISTPVQADLQTGVAAFYEKDYKTALLEFRPLARQGNKEAQHRIGVMYLNGSGLSQDSNKSVYWLEKSAEQGYFHSLFLLGHIYFKGDKVKLDQALAQEYFLRLYRVVKWGVYHNDPDAITELATMYLFGYGVPKNYKKFKSYLRLAANKGDAHAKEDLEFIDKPSSDMAIWFFAYVCISIPFVIIIMGVAYLLNAFFTKSARIFRALLVD
ncbi:tetratricopeptide repeat protein [Pseudomonadota bacterium]